MAKSSAKPTMMRFEPQSGWSDATSQVISINERLNPETGPENHLAMTGIDKLPTEALVDIGESMQEVFDSLKISDPRLQAWTQVHAAIRLISGKLQEKKALQDLVAALETEIEGVRSLAAELVSNA